MGVIAVCGRGSCADAEVAGWRTIDRIGARAERPGYDRDRELDGATSRSGHYRSPVSRNSHRRSLTGHEFLATTSFDGAGRTGRAGRRGRTKQYKEENGALSRREAGLHTALLRNHFLW